jgi:UDP-N-acetylmuramate--alanine ligase
VTGELVVRAARQAGVGHLAYVPRRDEVESEVAALLREGDVLLTLGAGDVTRVGPAVMTARRRGAR